MNNILEVARLVDGMSKMASTHKNDQIANALARTSFKLESFGKPFAEQLDEQDKITIRYYHANK